MFTQPPKAPDNSSPYSQLNKPDHKGPIESCSNGKLNGKDVTKAVVVGGASAASGEQSQVLLG